LLNQPVAILALDEFANNTNARSKRAIFLRNRLFRVLLIEKIAEIDKSAD